MTILETNRLKLCHMETSDAGFMLELLNSPSYHKYIGDRNVRSREDAKIYIVNRVANNYAAIGFGYYVVKRKADEKPVGICGLLKRETLEHVDIGFAFLPEQESKGYGFESASALMQWAKEKFGIKIIAGITLENNHSSIRLLEKLGLSFNKKILMDNEELLLYSGSTDKG